MIKSANIANIIAFLGELDDPTVIVYDLTISEDFIDKISNRCPNVMLLNIAEAEAAKDKFTEETVVFCLSLRSEKDLSHQLTEQGLNPVKGVYLVMNDVLPRMISGTGVIGKYKPGTMKLDYLGKSWVPEKENTYYAILCTPRSGSSFFCSLLVNNGLGLPKEHLRDEHPYLMEYRQEGGFELINFFKTIAATGTKNGYFGTKIISHFLEDVLAKADDKEKEFFSQNWFPRTKYIYLYRSDKVLQAISVYRARSTKFWHQWDGQSRKKGEVEYDFKAIAECYHQILEQEQQLLKRVRQLQEQWNCNITQVNYEELVQNTEAVMLSKIYPFLGYQEKSVKIEAVVKQIHGETEKEMAEKFEHDYKEIYSRKIIRTFQPS